LFLAFHTQNNTLSFSLSLFFPSLLLKLSFPARSVTQISNRSFDNMGAIPASKKPAKKVCSPHFLTCHDLQWNSIDDALLLQAAPKKSKEIPPLVASSIVAFLSDNGYSGASEAFKKELGKKNKLDLLNAPSLLEVDSVVQDRPLGLGHAVGCVEPELADDEDAIAVLLPDDLVLPGGVLGRMAAAHARYGGSVLCAIEVPGEKISAYGVFDVEEVADDPEVKRVRGMVEKPPAAEAPSNLAAAGRYILDRKIFDALRTIEPGAGGELQLTDAIALLIEWGEPVHVVVHEGSRHDLGNPGGYLKAAVDFALDRDDYGPELREWLVRRLADD